MSRLNLDHKLAGGSDTPVPARPQYRVLPMQYDYTLRLRPFSEKMVSAVELSRQEVGKK